MASVRFSTEYGHVLVDLLEMGYSAARSSPFGLELSCLVAEAEKRAVLRKVRPRGGDQRGVGRDALGSVDCVLLASSADEADLARRLVALDVSVAELVEKFPLSCGGLLLGLPIGPAEAESVAPTGPQAFR